MQFWIFQGIKKKHVSTSIAPDTTHTHTLCEKAGFLFLILYFISAEPYVGLPFGGQIYKPLYILSNLKKIQNMHSD